MSTDIYVTEMNPTEAYTQIWNGDFNLQAKSCNGIVAFSGSSSVGTFHKILIYNFEYSIDMLITAINNRTKERDYFRLYCDMLDNSITEEEFDNEIDTNEDKYVISYNNCFSDIQALRQILLFSEKINDVDSVEDFATLFSYNPESLKKLLNK